MSLRVVEQAALTDVGRQRDANEDSYVVAEISPSGARPIDDRPALLRPVFAVADGMGGAQAGEVASRTAAEVFETISPPDGTPEEQLTSLVQEANRRIFELAQSDASRRGMGTTLTAAMLEGDGVSVGHVGDSRAYRLREGKLEQLTHDHSLVAELERSGQIAPGAAEHHPQRSIITRALGPEREVEVDAHTHAARPGDVYLICSDGLTGMISDDEVRSLLRGSGDLPSAADALVRAANQSGGKDNITVVLFRVDDDRSAPADDPSAREDRQDTPSGSDTIHQGLSAEDVQSAVAEQPTRGHGHATSGHRQETAATGQRRAPVPPPTGRPAAGKALRRGRRRAIAGLVVAAVLTVVGVGLWLGASQVYFLGTNDDGLVTLYRGVPYEGPLGLELYSAEATSSVPARTIPAARRGRILDHEWRSRADGLDLVRQLEGGTLDTGSSR
ncbi:MAG TPA: Stp1/IreP family PP2C-type Ser/Thr phosphatase [Thermoleophilaceae bacterium]|nr:Stp1/IreP family PP2C-type Ser/Thr phosphatase [Thermoleophilaceae bacterium]